MSRWLAAHGFAIKRAAANVAVALLFVAGFMSLLALLTLLTPDPEAFRQEHAEALYPVAYQACKERRECR